MKLSKISPFKDLALREFSLAWHDFWELGNRTAAGWRQDVGITSKTLNYNNEGFANERVLGFYF
jgi:hypothetical protein